MSPHDAFLAAILTAPDDDLPRLVYADYLDENGDADRAAFIRVQCELARLAKDAPERAALVAREQALLDQNKERWIVPLVGLIGLSDNSIAFRHSFRRGFVHELELRNQGHWRPDVLAGLLDSPLVAATQLTLSSNDGDDLKTAELVRGLFAHPRLEFLRAVYFHEIGVTPEAMAAVVTRPLLTRLEAIGFWSGYYYGEPIRALAESFALPAVRSLGLSHLGLGDADVQVLAGSPRLANLTSLNLGGNSSITDAGVDALLDSPHLAGLTHLNLSAWMNRITAGAKAKLRARFGDGVKLDP